MFWNRKVHFFVKMFAKKKKKIRENEYVIWKVDRVKTITIWMLFSWKRLSHSSRLRKIDKKVISCKCYAVLFLFLSPFTKLSKKKKKKAAEKRKVHSLDEVRNPTLIIILFNKNSVKSIIRIVELCRKLISRKIKEWMIFFSFCLVKKMISRNFGSNF